jgi:hypothetical protein
VVKALVLRVCSLQGPRFNTSWVQIVPWGYRTRGSPLDLTALHSDTRCQSKNFFLEIQRKDTGLVRPKIGGGGGGEGDSTESGQRCKRNHKQEDEKEKNC